MDVLLGEEITPSMLISSNAPERLDGQVEWVKQAWPAGSIVTRASTTRRVYKAVYAVPATVEAPEDDISTNQLPYWQDIAPMNQQAMFDGQLKSQTIGPSGDLIVVIKPGAVTHLWIGNLTNALNVLVEVKNKTGGVIVWSESRDLLRPVTTYWEWWFAPFTFAGDAFFSGIPAYLQCEVTVTVSAGSGGTAGVGMLATGKITNLGETDWGVDAQFNNYSARSLNQTWGPTQATGGEVTKDVSYLVHVDAIEAPRVDKFMKEAMKRPAVYIPSGLPELEGVRIFGQAISSTLGYPAYNYVPLNLTVREFL